MITNQEFWREILNFFASEASYIYDIKLLVYLRFLARKFKFVGNQWKTNLTFRA